MDRFVAVSASRSRTAGTTAAPTRTRRAPTWNLRWSPLDRQLRRGRQALELRDPPGTGTRPSLVVRAPDPGPTPGSCRSAKITVGPSRTSASGQRPNSMPADLEFTGERFVPGLPGEIVYAHAYTFARGLVAESGLDAACGEGYGRAARRRRLPPRRSASTSTRPPSCMPSPRTPTAPTSNSARVGARRCRCRTRAWTSRVVEVEHLQVADQPRMLAEFARVLAPQGGSCSVPNRVEYSEARGVVEPVPSART